MRSLYIGIVFYLSIFLNVNFLTVSIVTAFPSAPGATIGINSGGSGESRKLNS
jgi:hypothetical protein